MCDDLKSEEFRQPSAELVYSAKLLSNAAKREKRRAPYISKSLMAQLQTESESGSKRVSPFLWFVKEKKEEVKRENAGLEEKEVLKVMAQMWKSMSPEEEKLYRQMAVRSSAPFELCINQSPQADLVGVQVAPKTQFAQSL